VLDYLSDALADRTRRRFSGSQDADEHYYTSAQGRAGLDAPFVDTTVYVDWNALAARALLRGATGSTVPSSPSTPSRSSITSGSTPDVTAPSCTT
jgi:hypothetical protein